MGIPVPNPVYLQALDASIWVPICTNSGIATTINLSLPPGASAVAFVELNDAQTGTTWRMCVLPSPSQPGGASGQLHIDPVTPVINGLPTQLLVSAPNGVIYFLQIANGVLQSGLAVPANANCNVSINALADNVQDRLEEPHGAGIFWLRQFEIYTAIVEAANELMLLVGRPTMSVQSPLNLDPNRVWQMLPKGLLAITDVYGPQSPLRKITLFALDYEQPSWGSDWENDTSLSGPSRWVPIGFNMFIAHPACVSAQQVTINAIAYPVAASWPYTGAETVPFAHEFFVLIEQYAAAYCRLKEGTSELQSAMPMLAEFYTGARRMTQIADRRDPLVFSRDFGVMSGVNSIQKR